MRFNSLTVCLLGLSLGLVGCGGGDSDPTPSLDNRFVQSASTDTMDEKNPHQKDDLDQQTPVVIQDPLLQARNLVSDIRRLGTVYTLNDQQTFIDAIEPAQSLASTDNRALQGVKVTGEVMARALETFLNSETALEFYSDPETLLIVRFVEIEGGLSLVIDQDFGSDQFASSVSLIALISNSDDNALNLDIRGSIQVGDSSVDIHQGTLALRYTERPFDLDAESQAVLEVGDYVINVFDLNLDVSIQNTPNNDDIEYSFNGRLSLVFDDFEIATLENLIPLSFIEPVEIQNNWDSNTIFFNLNRFDEALFALSGEFSSSEGARLSASIGLEVNDYQLNQICFPEFTYSGYSSDEYTCRNLEDDQPIYGRLSASFTMNIPGISNNAGIDLVLENTPQALNAQVQLDIGSSSYTIENQGQEALVVRNQTGAELFIFYNENNSEISGEIRVNNVVYASIDDQNGFVAVRYADGTNESF